MADYRIEFQIQRREDGEDDFTEIGFGSSGAWGSIGKATHILGSMTDNYEWETEPGMPDPAEIKQAEEAAR